MSNSTEDKAPQKEDTGAVPRSVTGFIALGAAGSVSATGGSEPTTRSHILTDFLDTMVQGMPGVLLHPQPCVRMEEAHKQIHHR
jgi:hypothetical protein